VPCATPEDLRGIPDDVLELLPAKVAKRCHAVAFQASSTQVKVALIEARNLAFQDEISFVATGGAKAFGISLWDRSENAETYSRETYPEVVKLLAKFVEGTPQVDTYEVSNSTFHKIAAPLPV